MAEPASRPATAGSQTPGDLPKPPWRRPSRPRRRQLNQDMIVEAAAVVLDRDGVDAVTIRAVAKELQTGPASLYAHIADKDELLELVLDRVIGEMPPLAADPRQWQHQLRQLCRDTLTVLLARNGIARVALSTVPSGPNGLRRAETTLAILRAGGLPDRVASFALDLISQFVVATAYETGLRMQARALDADTEWPAQIGRYFASLPPDQFPNIVELASALTAGTTEERFEFGLDVLIGGIEHLADDATDH